MPNGQVTTKEREEFLRKVKLLKPAGVNVLEPPMAKPIKYGLPTLPEPEEELPIISQAEKTAQYVADLQKELGFIPSPPAKDKAERQYRISEFRIWRKSGGGLTYDQWELMGMPTDPTVKLPPIEGRRPIYRREAKTAEDFFAILGQTLTKVPEQLAASVLQMIQPYGASVANRDWADKLVKTAQINQEKFVAEVSKKYKETKSPIKMTDIAQLPQNMAYSLASMGAGLLVGLPIALIPEPTPASRIAAWVAGTAASGVAAYNMTHYQIVQQYLELKNEEKIAETGKELTLDEENQLKKDFESKARAYGLWEAVPEAISNLAFAKILTSPLTKMVGRKIAGQIIGKLGLLYGEELLTETITQKGQSAIEVEAGLREGNITWVEAFKEVAPQTFLLTTVLGGVGQVSVSSYNKVKASLKTEIGETHPLYQTILTAVKDERGGLKLPEEKPEVTPKIPKVGKIIPKEVTPVTPEVTEAKPPRRDAEGNLIKRQPKEEWQITKSDYIFYRKEPQNFRIPLTQQEQMLAQQHERVVRQALSEGKPVPQEVLKDYPDLVKAPPAPVTPGVTRARPPARHEVPEFGEPGAIPPPTPPDVAKAGRRRVIEDRLRRGEPVPDRLLAEFPDLQTKVVGGFVAPTAKGSIEQALETAIKQAKKTGQNVYVFPTAEGMKLGKEPPPFKLQHYIVKPDGSYEYIKPVTPTAPVTPEVTEFPPSRTYISTELEPRLDEYLAKLTPKDREIATQFFEIIEDVNHTRISINERLPTLEPPMLLEMELRIASERGYITVGKFEQFATKVNYIEDLMAERKWDEALDSLNMLRHDITSELLGKVPEVKFREGLSEIADATWVAKPRPAIPKPAVTPRVTEIIPEPGMPEAGYQPAMMEAKLTKPEEIAPKVTPPIIEKPPVKLPAPLERRLEIERLLKEPAKNLPKGTTKIMLRKELADIRAELIPAEKALRQRIMAVVKTKGLTQSQYRNIFLDKGGSRQLSNITWTRLNKVLEAVGVARPTKIGVKTVLKKATEKNIQTLKGILISENKLTPEIYDRLMKDLKLSTDKYVDKNNFITEKEAKALIRQMNYEAEVGLTEWDVKVAQALANKPKIKSAIDALSANIKEVNLPTLKTKATINWRKFATEISDVPNDVGLSGTMSIMRALRRFQEQVGGREVTRIYDIAEMMVETRRFNDVTLVQRINRMKAEVPELITVIRNRTSMNKIQQWLDADLKIAKVEKPTDMTTGETAVAQLFRKEYDQWKGVVRLERFKDAYYHYKGNPNLIKEGEDPIAIPDAPLADIKEAINIYESQGEVALDSFLKTKDWGVIESGYSFSQVIHPQLRIGKRVAVRATTTSLHQRKGLEFPHMEKSPWERLVSYERQMIGLNLQPYFRKMDREFRRIVEGGRLKDPGRDANIISLSMQEIKGFPIESSVARFLLRTGGWMFGTLAKVPWMSVRNIHQNLAFHPDKSDIGRAMFTGGGFYGNPLTRNGRLDYTDALVHQFKAAMEEQLLMGYMGKTPIENVIRKTDYYHLSDKLNRFLSMAGSGTKAERALKAYLRDGDAQKFLVRSGALELSQTEQLRILEYLAMPEYNYGGVLETVSGGEAAIRDIANKITTLNHFNYIRYLRSSVEMGEMGRVLGSLVAFPRSVAERYASVFSKLRPSQRLSGAERRRAIHSLLALVIGSAIASALLGQITGKKRDAYNPFLILQYQVGGLAIGATEQLTELYRHLTNLTFAEDERERTYALEQLAIIIPGLGDSFIPFYGPTMNILESLEDKRYIDRETMRKVRAMFDESYEPNEEFYEIERTMLQKWQHALFGTNTPNPTDLVIALKSLQGLQENLGVIDEEEYKKALLNAQEKRLPFEYTAEDYTYTMNKLGSDINRAISKLDPSEVIVENGFSPLILEYMEYQTLFNTYKLVPADKRYNYRVQNPVTDANLFLWGYVTTLQSDDALNLVRLMMNRYNIPNKAVPALKKITAGKAEGFQPSGTWTPSPSQLEVLERIKRG